MASPIADTWTYATMLIENDWGERGTGFLVERLCPENYSKVFLATNKHVLNNVSTLREQAREITLYVNYQTDQRTLVRKGIKVPIATPDGLKIWREHTEEDVDVLAFDVTHVIKQFPNIARRYVRYSLFADKQNIQDQDITVGEEVLTLGYPLGLKQGTTNFPIVRSGILATRIGETFIDEVIEDGVTRERIVRGFLIDGATIPGSSGSPVILKPITGRVVRGNIMMRPASPLLLGIVAETKYAPVKSSGLNTLSFAGLGVAFDAETIRETIELFFDETKRQEQAHEE